jgi:hypothetical protein
VWPIELTKYDRSALLTTLEQEALNHLLIEWGDQERGAIPKALTGQLFRLLQPLYDFQNALGVQRRSCSLVWSVVCRGMHQYQTAYWGWYAVGASRSSPSFEISERYIHLYRISYFKEKFLKPFSWGLEFSMVQLTKCDCSDYQEMRKKSGRRVELSPQIFWAQCSTQ